MVKREFSTVKNLVQARGSILLLLLYTSSILESYVEALGVE